MTSVRILAPGEQLGEPALMEVARFLAEIGPYYPNLMTWLRDTVKPGLAAGTRRIFWERDAATQTLIGVGIAKNENGERKICTLLVDEDARGSNVGYRLTYKMLDWLDTDQPHFTVSDRKWSAMRRWIAHFGFKKSDEHNGLYVPGRTEYLYNDPHYG